MWRRSPGATANSWGFAAVPEGSPIPSHPDHPPGTAAPHPRVAIVVVSWNTRELLRRTLTSIRRFAPPVPVTTWVVDNASSDGSPEMVASDFPEVHLRALDRNAGFSAANNVALREILDTGCPWVLLLNPDAELLEGTLEQALRTGEETGSPVAARLLNPDGSLQPSTFPFPGLLRDLAQALWLPRLLSRRLRGKLFLGGYWDHDEPRRVDWALGAFLLVPRLALERAGLLPEEYPLFGEDLEWCHRLADAGFPLHFEPRARAVHHGNQAAGQLPAPWRIRRTHDTLATYLRTRRGSLVAGPHRGIQLLNYTLRAALFTLLGAVSRRRRVQGAEYRTILATLLSSRETGEEGS